MNIWQNDYIDKLYRTCLKYSLIGKNGEIYILRSPMCRDQPLGNHHCHNVVRGYKARGSDTYPPQPLGKPTSWSRFSVCLYCSGKPRIIPGSRPPHTGDGEKRKKWGNNGGRSRNRHRRGYIVYGGGNFDLSDPVSLTVAAIREISANNRSISRP